MFWRKVLLIFIPLVLGIGIVTFTLELNKASANYGLNMPGKPSSHNVEIEEGLLEELTEEGTIDFVVILAGHADINKANEIQDWSERGWYVYNTLREIASRTQAPIIAYAREQGIPYRSYFTNNMVYLENGDMEAVQTLAKLPGVLQIRQPQVAQIQPVHESEPIAPETYGWNLDILDPNGGLFGMQAAQVWQQYGITGQDIVVANIDTGAYYQHVAIERQYRGNLTGDIGGPYEHDYSWYQPFNIPCGNGTYPCDADYYGHGTGTIGLMTGETPDLSKQIGVAPDAKWIACMGCDDPPYCTEEALVGCADWMVAPCAIGDDPGDPSCDPDRRPQIINNSWGGGGCSTWYQPSVQAWVASGIFPAFAAGNAGGCGTVASPGDLPESFGVAAHFTNGGNAYSGGPSCFFPTPTCDPLAHDIDPHVNAPTGGVTAANQQAVYTALGGTSGASPHVAGTVALLWAANPGLIGQIDATYTILEQSANRVMPAPNCGKPACAGANDYPNYDFGWGYLDALAAVQMAGVGALGTLQGTVTEAAPMDAPGDPLADVIITAWRPENLYPLNGTTDANGVFTLTLSEGNYTITADGPQHGPGTISNVEVLSHTVTTLDIQLLPKGLLVGYVTDAETGAPLAATVGTTVAGPVETDPLTGYYAIFLGQGSQEVLVEANNYASQTIVVEIVSGQQTQQDFELMVSLELAPIPIQASVELFGNMDLTTLITNHTSVDYDYRLSHDASRAGDEGTILLVHDETLDENPDAFAIAFTNLDYDFVLIDGVEFYETSILDLLTYAAVVYTGVPSIVEQDHIIAYLDAGGRFLLADGSFTLYHHESRLHEVYLQALFDGVENWAGTQTGLDIMEGLYPNIGSAIVVYDSYAGPEGVGIFQVPGAHFSGIRTQRAGYRTIFLSFDLNRIGARDPGDALETDVAYRAMLWLLGYPVFDPWYSTNILFGTIPAESSGSFISQFTATPAVGIDQPGEFYAELHVEPQEIGQVYPRLDVPVHLVVFPAPTMGKVAGVVTSNRPGGPVATDLLIESAQGESWTTRSDWWTGGYGYWLEASTYTLTIAEEGYYSQTALITVTAGMTTTFDFFLTMAAPEISLTPLAIDESLTLGSIISDSLLVSNSGPEPLDFEIRGRDRGMTPIEGLSFNASPEDLDGANILFDEYHGGDPTVYDQLFTDLQALGATVDFWSTGPITSTVLQGYDILFIGDFLDVEYRYDELNAIDTFVRHGGGLFVSYECCDDNTAPMVTEMFDIVYIGAGGTAGITQSIYPHPTTIGVGSVYLPSPQYLMTTTITGTAEIVLYDRGGAPAAAVNEVDNGKVFVMPDQEFWDTVYDDADNTRFALNTFGWLYGDVPWLSTDVVSATVAPGESLTVTVTLDSNVVDEPAIYYGDLILPNNDPLSPSPGIPITMTVTPTADLGRLYGTVTSNRPGSPLSASLIIENSMGITLTVNTLPSTGEYQRWLPAGPYTVTVTSNGYITQAALVVVPPSDSVQLDFELELDAPGVAIFPSTVEETVIWGLTATQQITVNNFGVQDLDFLLVEEDLGFEPLTQAPKAYAYDFENAAFASFFLDAPEDWTIIATWPYQGFNGGDFRLNDFSQLYVFHGAYLYTLDTTTGVDTYIAYIGVPYPHTLVGMTIAADGTIYAVTDHWYGLPQEPHESYLWTIDPLHGTPTMIGQITNAEYIADIAINLSGEMYAVDLEQDVLIHIDPSTAAGTVVGSLGFDLWTGTLDFDDDSGVLYMGTWDFLPNQGYLWTLNTTTGTPTVIGNFPPGNGISFLAIASDGLSGIPWLTETPTNGTVLPDGTESIVLTFDASNVSGPGYYLGNLHVVSNDPLVPDLPVPITMTVLAGDDAGQIEGIVVGTGYCDNDQYPIEADVLIESSSGLTWTATTDPQSGYYSQWVISGSYTLTAQSTEHVTSTTTVQVSAGQTTVQDFYLRLFEPCLVLTPTTYSMTLSVGNRLTQTLTITNDGARDLIWAVRETTDTLFIPSIPAFNGVMPQDLSPLSIEPLPSTSVSFPSRNNDPLFEHINPLYGEPAFGLDTSTFDLVHIPDISEPESWQVLSNVGVFYSGGDFWHGDFSKLFALDFYTNEFVTLDMSTGVRTVIGMAETLPGHHWTGLTAATDGTFYGVSTECNVVSALYTIERLTGEATIVGTTTSAPCLIDLAINAQGQMYAVDISSDALFQINPATGAATVIGLLGFNANHAQSMDFEEESGILYWAAADQYNGSLRRIDTTTGASLHIGYFPNYTGVDCLAFATGGGEPFWRDVPWLSEVPTTGVTLADESFNLDVVFDTNDLTSGVCYTAGLGVLHDDPLYEQPALVPINLCVTEPWPVFYLTKSVNGDMVLPGDLVTYTINFGNDGSLETGITISDVLPVEVEYSWSEPAGMLYDPSAHELVWKNLTLDHGTNITATIGVTIHTDVEVGTWFTNTVYLLWREDILTDWATLQVGDTVEQPAFYLPLIQKSNVIGHRSGIPEEGFPASSVSLDFYVAEGFLSSQPGFISQINPGSTKHNFATLVNEDTQSTAPLKYSYILARSPPRFGIRLMKEEFSVPHG